MAKLNVLYVDDEPELLDITKMLLEQDSELTVSTEQNPIVAIDMIARDEYDVIVSDYQMSGMSGIELLKEVRKLDHVPFILFTGRGREEVAIEALNNGADFYLQKGGDHNVQFEELKNAIMQLARRKGMEDQRRVAEQALRESENKLRDIFNSVNDAIFIHDMEGHFLEVNDVVCTRLGYSRDELLRMTPQDINPLELLSLLRIRFEQLRTKGYIVYETVHVTKDGMRIPTEISCRAITYEGKAAFLAVARDITEREQAEEELKMANEKLDLLSDITRHDLNNQLITS